ncbi:MAG: chromosomal replication initiator protein DnaA, partial [Oscillospiraceae bacterium]
RINEFHNKYRKADILLIDDIQFIAGKERTQEEFFHTFNELYQVGKQIVITSDRPPKDIQTLEDRLKSRFEWGLLTDISEPDFETRVAIIRRKADLLKLDLSIDVCEFIANKIKTNIRQLEGTVKKMKANYILLGATPNITSAQSVVKEILSDNKPLPLTIENIIEEVSKTYSVTAEDIRSDKRMASVSNARKVAMYIVREITGLSLSLIGEEFGGRDHSTVIYAINKIEADMKKNDRQRSIIEDLIKNLQTK